MAREPYKTYSKEFKIEAVRLAEKSDKPITQVARELGVRQNQIYKRKGHPLEVPVKHKIPLRPAD